MEGGASVKGMGSVDGVGCSILIGLLAHPFVSFQIIPSERFVFFSLGGHRPTQRHIYCFLSEKLAAITVRCVSDSQGNGRSYTGSFRRRF